MGPRRFYRQPKWGSDRSLDGKDVFAKMNERRKKQQEESIHSLLRVKTKADARYYLQSVPKEYEISINGKQYIRGFVFISFINKFMEENKKLFKIMAESNRYKNNIITNYKT